MCVRRKDGLEKGQSDEEDDEEEKVMYGKKEGTVDYKRVRSSSEEEEERKVLKEGKGTENYATTGQISTDSCA